MLNHAKSTARGWGLWSAVSVLAAIGVGVAVMPATALGDDPAAPAAAMPGAAMPNMPGQGVQAPPAAQAPQEGNSNQSSGDFPHQEVMAVPPARAQAMAAKWINWQAETDLQGVVDRLHDDFESSTEMVNALREEKDAYADYDEARQSVLEKLREDQSYRAMTLLVERLAVTLQNEKHSNPPTEEELQHTMATASLKLSYATSISAMEAVAMAQDSRVQETRARLVTAGRQLAELRARGDRQVRRDEQFVAARRAFEDSRIAHVTADAYLDSVIEARNIAVDYAYYLHGWDYIRYASGYGNYGYPSFGYPYYGGIFANGLSYGVSMPNPAYAGYTYSVTRR